MCELTLMEIQSLRKELGLSLEAFASAIGLKSKGQVSDLEAGNRAPSVPVALAIERLSQGRISAADLNRDVAMARGVSLARDGERQGEAV